MMMIPTSREKERTRIIPHRLVEPEPAVVERRGLLKVGDMKMDMPDDRPARHSLPRRALHTLHGGLQHALDVERNGGHHQQAIAILPARARAVGVDFDPEPVRIGEIDGLADEVVRHSSVGAELLEVREEAPERGPIGQEDREVIQTDAPSPRHRLRSLQLLELHERFLVPLRAEHETILRLLDYTQPEDALVVVARSAEIADLETHATEMGLVR